MVRKAKIAYIYGIYEAEEGFTCQSIWEMQEIAVKSRKSNTNSKFLH